MLNLDRVKTCAGVFSLALMTATSLPQRAIAADPGAAAAPFQWPNGARAAVSLAYDDALDSQLNNALPALQRVGLKASFYLQLSNPAVALRMQEWRAAAAAGHELGNHSLFHQCSAALPDRAWVQPQRNLDTTLVQQMRDQVVLANTMLYAIDGRIARTYTTPCGDLLAAGQPYLPAIKGEFVAIKAGNGDGSGVVPSMQALDLHAVPVAAPVGLSGQQLIAMVKAAGEKGTMVNFTFHGIGGDYLTTSSEAHEELLRFLAANRATYWTDTFLNIMEHVSSQRQHEGWVLDWSDEFNGSALDARTWVAEIADHGYGNNELQAYTARPKNLRVENGMLVIEAHQEAYGKRQYTSARIKTAGLKERQYGRYEARMKLPRGQGIWPAFWMLGADIGKAGWPGSGEIDIMEFIGKEASTMYGTLHGPGYSGEHGLSAPSKLANGLMSDDFHVVAVEWEPGEIRWYRDGQLFHRARPESVKGAWVFEHPFFVLLNLAVGGYWPGNPDQTTQFPQQMLVDYVRVYRRGG